MKGKEGDAAPVLCECKGQRLGMNFIFLRPLMKSLEEQEEEEEESNFAPTGS